MKCQKPGASLLSLDPRRRRRWQGLERAFLAGGRGTCKYPPGRAPSMICGGSPPGPSRWPFSGTVRGFIQSAFRMLADAVRSAIRHAHSELTEALQPPTSVADLTGMPAAGLDRGGERCPLVERLENTTLKGAPKRPRRPAAIVHRPQTRFRPGHIVACFGPQARAIERVARAG